MPRKPDTRPLEHVEQAAFVQWFRAQYPGVTIYAVPNGSWFRGKSKFGLITKLKKEGMTNGIPDLCIPALYQKPCGCWQGVYIEMKRQRIKGLPHNGPSDEQKRYLSEFSERGYITRVANGFDEARAIVLALMEDR